MTCSLHCGAENDLDERVQNRELRSEAGIQVRNGDACLWVEHGNGEKCTGSDILWEINPPRLADVLKMLPNIWIFFKQPLPPPQPNHDEPSRSRNHKTAKCK